ncbi:hypothetical protein GCM10007103_35220 [Salinimicrobium marinum]|uniref:Uncharacterized protein n=1 Tax=Salinimicrobium marinum TaxID=680283 RepID=A0A918SLB7_9FLAO|nr:hypothetical protein [Salinimicrobium marinum]GHA51729.1 hypothetical protein GCM10007103_35220 [Salinimicrobium marinum]
MKKSKIKVDFKKYFGEGLLIVFSVLFALFINKTYEDAKINRDKNNALKQIKAELIDNQKILDEWIVDHEAIIRNLDDLIQRNNDSIPIVAENQNYIQVQLILNNKNLIDKPLSNSAWSSAQSIGIIAEFDFKTLQNISQAYELQQDITDVSIDKIAERIFLEFTNVENVNAFLVELKMRFQNLQGQEYRLRKLYRETIHVLE